MQQEFLTDALRLISEPRLRAFRGSSGSDEDALCRYLWNIALCEALYPTFQGLEVSYRNAVHGEIGKAMSKPEWLINDPAFLYESERLAIPAALEELKKQGKPATEPYLVAQLKFGFWTSLLDARYDRIWHKIIKGVFPNMPRTIRTRAEASVRMNAVRRLRNAALHHHSIWHWRELHNDHLSARTWIAWIGASVAAMTEAVDRFPSVHKATAEQFRAIAAAFSIKQPTSI